MTGSKKRPVAKDELSRLTLREKVGPTDPDPGAPADVQLTPGLPMVIDNPPTGLGPEERAEWRARFVRARQRLWAEHVAENWRIHRAEERTALAAWAADRDFTYDEGKLHLAYSGLLEAMASASEATTVRVGQSWVTAADGRQAVVEPSKSHPLGLLQWLAQEAISRAEATLREHHGLPARGSPEVATEPPEIESDEPQLEELIRAETMAETRQRVDALYAAARDDIDRALLDALREGRNREDAAQELGLSRDTLRKRLWRLKKRAG